MEGIGSSDSPRGIGMIAGLKILCDVSMRPMMQLNTSRARKRKTARSNRNIAHENNTWITIAATSIMTANFQQKLQIPLEDQCDVRGTLSILPTGNASSRAHMYLPNL